MRVVAAAVCWVVAGCAVGPDFKRPAAPGASGYTAEPLTMGGRAQRFVPGQDIPGDWWTLFHSPGLNALVERALKANPSLEAAQAALRQAQENRLAQVGAYLPTASVGFQAQANKTPLAALSSASSTGSAYYSLYTGQVSVGFVPDVFGLNRRTVESLDALAENQRYQLEATYLSLTSNLAAAAVQEALLRAQIDATQKIITIDRASVALLEKQLGLGSVAQQDVLTQQAALAAAEATLPPLQKQLAQQRDLLAALTGQLPDAPLAETFELGSIQAPAALPVSLPSALVRQRPDILAAEEMLRSENATIGIAIANRLPQFNLTALLGSSPAQIGNLFGPGTGFYTLAAGVTQPVFEGFSLLHRQRAAEAAVAAAAAQYRQTVITAFQNVADTLRALQVDEDAIRTAETAERTAQSSLDIAQAQLRLGAVNNLVLLTAQQAYFQALLNTVQARAGRLSDTVALYQALGGGWWHRDDAAKGSEPGLL
jgi:NodT family efflux transporter outer membrane factor (OMF) lipoprotein